MTVQLVNTAEAHFGAVRFVGFDPSNDKLISIGEDEGRLYIWNTENLTQSTGTDIEQKTENNSVRAAIFQNDTTFIFGGDDRQLTQTDWPNCHSYSTIIQSENEIYFASSKWDTKTIAFSDHHIIRFQDPKNTEYPQLDLPSEIIWIGYSPNAQYFAFSCSDSTLVVFETTHYTEIYRKQYNIGSFHPMWGPSDILLIPDSENNGTIIILTMSNMKEHHVKDAFTSVIVAAVLSNSFLLAVVDNAHVISFSRLNDDFTLTPITSINYSGDDLTTLAWGNSMTNFFALGDSLGTLYLYQLTLPNNQEANDSSETTTTQELTPTPPKNQTEEIIKQSTLNSLLTGRSGFTTIKVKKLAKKAKGKGKQQTLNLASAPKSSKKIESTRKFLSDNSDSEEDEEDEPENHAEKTETKTVSFLDDDIDDIDIDVSKNKNQTFLEDDDIDDQDILPEKPTTQPFLSDDNTQNNELPKEVKATSMNFISDDDNNNELPEQAKPVSKKFISDDEVQFNSVDIPNDDVVPGYDEITLPDSDDHAISALPDDDNNNESTKSEVFSSMSSLDYSTSIRFMPNSYPNEISNSKILCWNGQGSIVMHSSGTSYQDQYIEISPYGDSDFPSKRIDDAYQVTLATVDKYGYVISTNDTVVYHRHNEYGEEAEVIKSFSIIEDVQLVACGVSFFAVATANKFLHIFSTSGFELAVFTLNGRLITMVGHENFLFVVSGKHHYELYDVFDRSLLASGILPIPAPLKYAGFNMYDNSVVIEGGNGQLLTLSYSNGIRWTPVADLSRQLGNDSNDFFIVEVFGNQVNGMNIGPDSFDLSTSNDFPESLNEIDFEAPTMNSMLDNCIISLLNYDNSIDKEKDGRRFDRDLIRHQFNSALNDNRLLLAYQIACQLKTIKGLDAAIQLCDQKGQAALSNRLYQLKTSREEGNEEEDDDESINYELNEPYDEPEPFVRTEEITEEEEQEEEKNNAFLSNFKPVDQKIVDDSDEEDKPDEKVAPPKSSSSDDDLDAIEVPEPVKPIIRKETSKRADNRNTEKQKKKRKETKKVDDEHNSIEAQHESEDTNIPVKTTEKKKHMKNKEEKEKPPPKPKSTRKKLFNKIEKNSDISPLDRFGFT